MLICDHAHSEILFEGKSCPLCRSLEENRKLRVMVNHLQFELLINETELLLNFDIDGDRKIFSCVGQA